MAMNQIPLDAITKIRSWLDTQDLNTTKVTIGGETVILSIAVGSDEAKRALNEVTILVKEMIGGERETGTRITRSKQSLVNSNVERKAPGGPTDLTIGSPRSNQVSLAGGTLHPQSTQGLYKGESSCPGNQRRDPQRPLKAMKEPADLGSRRRAVEPFISDDGRPVKRARLRQGSRVSPDASRSDSTYQGREDEDASDQATPDENTSDTTMSEETVIDEFIGISSSSSSSHSDSSSEVSIGTERTEWRLRGRTARVPAEQEEDNPVKGRSHVPPTSASSEDNGQPKVSEKLRPRLPAQTNAQTNEANGAREAKAMGMELEGIKQGQPSGSNEEGNEGKADWERVDDSRNQMKRPAHLGTRSDADINAAVTLSSFKAQESREKPIPCTRIATGPEVDNKWEAWLVRQAAKAKGTLNQKERIARLAPEMERYARMIGGDEVLQSWVKVLNQWRAETGSLIAEGTAARFPLTFSQERTTASTESQVWTLKGASERICSVWDKAQNAEGTQYLTEIEYRKRKVDLAETVKRENRMLWVEWGTNERLARKAKTRELASSVVKIKFPHDPETVAMQKWNQEIGCANKWHLVYEYLGWHALAVIPENRHMLARWIEERAVFDLKIWLELVLEINPSLVQWSGMFMRRIGETAAGLLREGSSQLLRFETMHAEAREKEQDRGRLLDYV
ncbi:MAG: hypothetical protein M1820_009402 [Bogoriella megaspora]|nr:MAG: hypothetical protein M1820_009402 [Bogoriella megaspora]